MKKGSVAFIDILGFSGIWQRRNAEDVLNILNSVPKLIQDTYKKPPPEKNWPKSSNPECTILSDTIVVTIESEQPHCLFLLGNIICELILYFNEQKIFLRGAVAYGDYTHSGNTFVGPMIDDVASWYEVGDWVGIISTPKTNYLIDRLQPFKVDYNNFAVQSFIKYDVPDKNGDKHTLNCLNWPGYLQAAFKELPNNDVKSKVRILMEKMFTEQSEFNAAVLKKYEHTLKFVDYAVSGIELKLENEASNKFIQPTEN